MLVTWRSESVDVRESGAGAPVVLVHGYPLDGAMWSGVARLLATEFRVLKPDLPGRGATPGIASPSIDAYAEFIETLLEALGAPAGLAGFSMGGYVALAVMRRRPDLVRALALVDTRAGADDATGRAKRDESIATIRSEGVQAIVAGTIEKLIAPASAKRADLVERTRRMILRQPPDTVVADLTAMKERPDSTEILPRMEIPTLVVVGEEDVLTPPAESRAMFEAIPGAQLVTIAQAGHLTPVEQPRAVAAALSVFFAGNLSDR